MFAGEKVVKTVTMPLRFEGLDDQIKTIRPVIVYVDDSICEVDLDGQILGYIQHVGKVFVALAGTRLDRAEECGQSLLWDKAASTLVAATGHLQAA